MTVSVEKQIWKEESCKENRERKSMQQKKTCSSHSWLGGEDSVRCPAEWAVTTIIPTDQATGPLNKSCFTGGGRNTAPKTPRGQLKIMLVK